MARELSVQERVSGIVAGKLDWSQTVKEYIGLHV